MRNKRIIRFRARNYFMQPFKWINGVQSVFVEFFKIKSEFVVWCKCVNIFICLMFGIECEWENICRMQLKMSCICIESNAIDWIVLGKWKEKKHTIQRITSQLEWCVELELRFNAPTKAISTIHCWSETYHRPSMEQAYSVAWLTSTMHSRQVW